MSVHAAAVTASTIVVAIDVGKTSLTTPDDPSEVAYVNVGARHPSHSAVAPTPQHHRPHPQHGCRFITPAHKLDTTNSQLGPNQPSIRVATADCRAAMRAFHCAAVTVLSA